MFKNKHVIASLIIAPILAVIAFFAVDSLVAEKPHQAEAGRTYPMVAKSNCRYSSGQCTFENGDFKLQVRVNEDNLLEVESTYSLQAVEASVVPSGQTTSEQMRLEPVAADKTHWQRQLGDRPKLDATLRLVVANSRSIFFGQTGMAFIDYETTFGKDLRR